MKHRILLAASITTLVLCADLHAQCSSSGGTNGGVITPTTSWQTVSGVNAGTYYLLTVPASACPSTYIFSLCAADGGSAGWDSQITITDNTSGTTYFGYNDDYCGLQSYLAVSLSAGTYRVFVSQYFCSTGGTGAVLAYRYQPASVNTPNYTIVDDATSVSPFNCATITPNLVGQRGCAWDVNSTLNMTANFSYDFVVNFGNNDAGADGMAFVIQNDPRGRCACGSTGGALGAGGIVNSLVLEFDTYLNFEDRDDFNTSFIGCAGSEEPDHLDIWLNGSINPDLDGNCNSTAVGERVIPTAIRTQHPPGTNYNIENGADHTMRVQWNAGSQTITFQLMNLAATITYGTASYTFNPLTVFGTNNPYFGFTGATGALTNQQYFCLPATFLPVELVSFGGKCANNSVQVEWTTSSERNNAYFRVERSADLEHFIDIGRVEGGGNSNILLHYALTDTAPLPGLQYYRLTQVDFDGSTQVFEPIAVHCNTAETPALIWPNPCQEWARLRLNNVSFPDITTIQVSDMAGKILSSQQLALPDDYTDVQLPVADLAPGIYLVTVSSGHNRQTYRLVKN